VRLRILRFSCSTAERDPFDALDRHLVAGLVLAFALGAVAQRLKISPLVGYLLAGVVIGLFTPGFAADQHIADQLAEIGVILPMFGVGLHFSLSDLLSVRAIAIPDAFEGRRAGAQAQSRADDRRARSL
jgi:predicted Kef-type K+ transport protein